MNVFILKGSGDISIVNNTGVVKDSNELVVNGVLNEVQVGSVGSTTQSIVKVKFVIDSSLVGSFNEYLVKTDDYNEKGLVVLVALIDTSSSKQKTVTNLPLSDMFDLLKDCDDEANELIQVYHGRNNDILDENIEVSVLNTPGGTE